ncbi:MAG TPA: UDP-galactose-4-epimerase [Bacteroidales bacterium]|nr:UDP-galactose-4-epimerase [Bacteroidales bacterium]
MESLLFTGASGFLGLNTLPILNHNYQVDTLGISNINTYQIDIAKQIPILKKKYDVVLHAAGKAHVVPKTEAEIKSFYDINVQGTKNLCRALEITGYPKALVFVSTVAVYGCEKGLLVSEDQLLNGITPYADSKKQAEKFLCDWCTKNRVILTILRPSLLAGINPPGNLGAMIKGIQADRYLSVAEGRAQKSVAMASDIAALIPICENKGGIFNLCDSHNPTFHELELLVSKQLGKRNPISIPYWLALFLAQVGNLFGKNAPINSLKLSKITTTLTFSNKKIIDELGFIPSDVLSNFIIR